MITPEFFEIKFETDQAGNILFFPWSKSGKRYVVPSPEKKNEIKQRLYQDWKYSGLSLILYMMLGVVYLVHLLENNELDKESLQYWVIGFSVGAPAVLFIVWQSFLRRAVVGLPRAATWALHNPGDMFTRGKVLILALAAGVLGALALYFARSYPLAKPSATFAFMYAGPLLMVGILFFFLSCRLGFKLDPVFEPDASNIVKGAVKGVMLVALVASALAFIVSGAVFLNGFLDSSQEMSRTVRVISKTIPPPENNSRGGGGGKCDCGVVEVESWYSDKQLERTVPLNEKFPWMHTSPEDPKIQPLSTWLSVTTKQGWLGMEWVSRVELAKQEPR